MLNHHLPVKLTMRLIAAGFHTAYSTSGYFRTRKNGWRLLDGAFNWSTDSLKDAIAETPEDVKALPAVTYAEALDWLASEKRARYGFCIGENGRWSFSLPTENRYKFLRNTSTNPDRCLETGIGRILDTL